MASQDCILKVSNLSVKLKDQTILDKITFKVIRGTTMAIIGPNGAGKTMLFRTLLNMIPHTGKIEWKDRGKIGYVPQSFSISDIPISVREFLLFKSKQNIENTINLVGLSEKILEKRLDRLSGGELQRVLIAWAIVDNPNILLFDEPTSSVDIGSEELIYEMLNRIEKENKITMLLISHNAHVVEYYSDYLLALDKSMIFSGKSSKIKDPNLLRKIFGSHTIMKKHKH